MSSPARQRAAAARLLRRVVVDRRTTDQAMAGRNVTPLTHELVLGSLRHFPSLEQAIDGALAHPLKAKDQDIRLLMIVGAYQLRHMRIPDHAAIFETVKACRELGKPWATGLVNAVLRKLAAGEGTAIQDDSSERSFEHPEWLQASLRISYPDADAIMAANNARAPMALRINVARTSVAAYLERLTAAGMPHRPPGNHPRPGDLSWGPETRLLLEPVPADTLPGFAAGDVAVQDAAAQLAAPILTAAAPRPGSRLLDACAAPGGKAFHLLERCPELAVTVLENQSERLAALTSQAQRLGHHPITVLGDATTLDWWDGAPFSHVLLDAPCSGTGTLRRHPDIKLLREPADIDRMSALQQRLLANLWRVLEPGGTLLYCTCSILAAENDDVIAGFLAEHHDAASAGFSLASGRAMRHGWQLLPTDPDTDGFYYARLNKAGNAHSSKARA